MSKEQELKQILTRHVEPLKWLDEIIPEILQLFQSTLPELPLLKDCTEVTSLIECVHIGENYVCHDYESAREGYKRGAKAQRDLCNRYLMKVLSELPLLSEEEKLTVSLVSKYPYKYIKDVIEEAIGHERDLCQRTLQEYLQRGE